MFWVDQIADEIIQAFPGRKSLIIRDEKTASGRVHIGSLRGVVIHAVVAQALKERGINAQFIYEINDNDPMDGLPVYVDAQKFLPHMGKPLKDVPASDPHSKAKNYPEQWGYEFIDIIHKLGFKPKIVWAAEDYRKGMYDEWIVRALEHPKEIRDIYKKVSGSEKGEEWNPVQIVCENCGKVGTTTVVDWDGKEATYQCEEHKVQWAKGCGYKGKTKPFKGRGKLPWKVEWAAKWQVYKVDIEGSGKDHNAAGGSHEVAEGIAREVFKGRIPFNIPYEFFLFGGAKMSASKGLGASSKEVADLLPPEILRFLMTRTWPHQPIDFNVEGETIPRLYDRHDDAARLYFSDPQNTSDDARAFYYSQVDTDGLKPHFLARFSRVAFTVQLPHLDFWKEMEKVKGAPLTKHEKIDTEERRTLSQLWVENYAPESYKFSIQGDMPEAAYTLTKEQKEWLLALARLMTEKEWKGEELHNQIHELRKQSSLQPRQAFEAIYKVLLGKDSGPQAGWFLEALEKKFVIERFRESITLKPREKKIVQSLKSPYLVVSSDVREKFPELLFGVAIIHGVNVVKSAAALESYKKEILEKNDWGAVKKTSSILQEWKTVYKKFGVDPTKRKPSPVALVDRLAAGKPFPQINTVVDLYNLMVVRDGCSNGAFNEDTLAFPVTLRFSKKGELFQGLGEEKPKPLDPGELIYSDAENFIFVRDLNHRDSEKTAVKEGVKNLFILCESNAASGKALLGKSLNDTCEKITEFCGGKLVYKEVL